jgi:cyclopropane-fatty-acyl-phospholipid synthase
MNVKSTLLELSASSSFWGRTLPSAAVGPIKRGLLSKMKQLKYGCIEFIDGDERFVFGDPSAALQARVEVLDRRFYPLVAFEGTIGAGEAWIHRFWTSPDVTALVRIFTLNRDMMQNFESGLAMLARPFLKAYHSYRKNTVQGSARNIEDHYDLGNDFFSLFLDETMTYSCALFETPEQSLRDAQIAKYERICRKLNIKASDHVVEIGTGWGGFAMHAAKTHGCRVTTTTISKAQHDFAKARIKQAGLDGQIEVLLRDYRAMEGSYDKLVSIEMIEAVGADYYGQFFETCARLLKPDGLMLIQAITIADQIFDEARRSVDFIQRFVFPGSCIPSIIALSSVSAQTTDLNLIHLEDITPNYPRTLRLWLEGLKKNWDKILALGYPESLLRLWEFYLCYCEGGFLERNIGDVHLLFAKSGWRGQAPLGDFGAPGNPA